MNTSKEMFEDQILTLPSTQTDFDPSSPEAKLQLRQQLAADRQSELEAEQARLEEERNKIEQRRLELEAEKKRHAAECERLRLEAEEAQRRAEQERKRLEKERLEQKAAEERRRIAEKIAALETKRDRARAEEERLEKEAMVERRRAEQRLNELKAAQELHRAEQERIELEAKKELERAEKLLLELSGFEPDTSKPDHNGSAAPQLKLTAPETKTPEKPSARTLRATDEIAAPNFDVPSSGRWRVPAVAAASLLIAGAVLLWFAMPAADGPTPVTAVQSSTIVVPDPSLAVTEASPVSEPPQVTSQIETPIVEAETAANGQKHPQISSLPEKQKKPAAEKPAAAKKKVTVDDLINDN